jgi:TIR domain
VAGDRRDRPHALFRDSKIIRIEAFAERPIALERIGGWLSAGSEEPGSARGPKVFITYRREESAAHAGRLYDAMVSRFGESNVFMDVDMAPGVDFVERITEAVAACQVLIVVMGPRWATVEDEQGRPRLADPEDFVRLEVETALRRPEVTPIPVLVAGARMPNRQDLPREVRAITRRNALELGDQRWRHDVGRLISALDELLAESSPAPSPRSPERDGTTRQAAPADAAEAARQTAPPSTVAATTPADAKPAAPPPTGAGRFWPWALTGAVATAAIVVAVVLAVGGDGSPTRAAHFTEADLPQLVLAATEAPGNLRFEKEESGPYVEDLQGIDEDFMRILTKADAVGYRSAFNERNEGATYDYSASTAAVFEDENAAQSALNRLTADYQGPTTEDVSPHDLGDDRFAALINERTPEYICFWRTGNLLQSFYLIWNGPPPSEDAAREFVDEMDALTE